MTLPKPNKRIEKTILDFGAKPYKQIEFKNGSTITFRKTKDKFNAVNQLQLHNKK